MYFSTSFYN